jgi:ABC-type uncharacterized transport system permease subunit
VLLGAGAVAHLAHILVASFVAHACPVYSIHFFLSMASLLASAVYLAARRRFRIHALGLILAPVGLVLALTTFFLGRPAAPGGLTASFIGLHVFANLCGAGLFLLASGAAALYLVHERRLKRKRSVLAVRLPSLGALDKAAHRFLLAGFPLLTLGLVTGTVAAQHAEIASVSELLRTVFGWATWLLFAAVLLLRAAAGWRGRRAAYGTIAGFACALVVLLIYVLRPWFDAAGGVGG